jgi:hypothetical protein
MPIVVSPAAAMPVGVSPDVAAVRSTTAAVIRSAVAAVVVADRSEVVVAVARAAAVAATAAVTDKFYLLANNGRCTFAGRFVLREASPQIAASPHSRILKYTL